MPLARAPVRNRKRDRNRTVAAAPEDPRRTRRLLPGSQPTDDRRLPRGRPREQRQRQQQSEEGQRHDGHALPSQPAVPSGLEGPVGSGIPPRRVAGPRRRGPVGEVRPGRRIRRDRRPDPVAGGRTDRPERRLSPPDPRLRAFAPSQELLPRWHPVRPPPPWEALRAGHAHGRPCRRDQAPLGGHIIRRSRVRRRRRRRRRRNDPPLLGGTRRRLGDALPTDGGEQAKPEA
mmetsp:Transcript_2688/g.7372  ORF Transcript_2688/g.7372 Transcript_2688/m.7372 type:complete len:231 (+) Transcript_2688:39-731(+)